MRKLLTLVAVLLVSACAFAQNEVTIAPAAGMPLNGDGSIDASQIAAGSVVCFDISFTNVTHNQAGHEFRIEYPAYLAALSETDADWQAGTASTAIYNAGAFITGGYQMLPADGSGNRTAGTVDNARGEFRHGLLWTNPADRPQGSVGTANPGGVIGQICFTYNPNNQANCVSSNESVRVFLAPSEGAGGDIFADDTATRVAVVTSTPSDVHGRPGLAAYFGDQSKLLRGDADKGGTRGAADALTALRCTFLGKANCSWSADTDADYENVMDYNCDGSVNATDALGLLKLTLGVGNRPSSKNLNYYALSSNKGSFVAKSELVASVASVVYSFNGVDLLEPTISDSAKKDGWFLVHEITGETLQYTLVNARNDMVNVPEVTIQYRNASAGAQIAVLNTEHYLTNNDAVAYSPLIEDQVARDGSSLDAQVK